MVPEYCKEAVFMILFRTYSKKLKKLKKNINTSYGNAIMDISAVSIIKIQFSIEPGTNITSRQMLKTVYKAFIKAGSSS